MPLAMTTVFVDSVSVSHVYYYFEHKYIFGGDGRA